MSFLKEQVVRVTFDVPTENGIYPSEDKGIILMLVLWQLSSQLLLLLQFGSQVLLLELFHSCLAILWKF